MKKMHFGWIVSKEIDNILDRNKLNDSNKNRFKAFLIKNGIKAEKAHIIATSLEPYTGITKGEAEKILNNYPGVYWGRFYNDELKYWREFKKEEFEEEINKSKEDGTGRRYLLRPEVKKEEWNEVK